MGNIMELLNTEFPKQGCNQLAIHELGYSADHLEIPIRAFASSIRRDIAIQERLSEYYRVDKVFEFTGPDKYKHEGRVKCSRSFDNYNAPPVFIVKLTAARGTVPIAVSRIGSYVYTGCGNVIEDGVIHKYVAEITLFEKGFVQIQAYMLDEKKHRFRKVMGLYAVSPVRGCVKPAEELLWI